jgi:hypothetical protein
MIGDAPSWAFDMFTREGRRAIQSFLARDSATSRWTKKHVPGDKRVEFLGNLIFAVEGGPLKSRLVWSMGELLRQCAKAVRQGRQERGGPLSYDRRHRMSRSESTLAEEIP